MTPVIPEFATVHSMISLWARCQKVDIRAPHLRGNQASLLAYDFSLGAKARLLASMVFDGVYSAEQIVDLHTHIPLYASVMPVLQAFVWRESLLSGDGGSRDTVAQAIRRSGDVEAPTLRRCRLCMEEDREQYGCAHWRVFHQWPVVRHCLRHGTVVETRCARCGTPFVRGHDPSLPDDPCPHCGCVDGAAAPYSPPVGYWPLVRLMQAALMGREDALTPVKRALAMLGSEQVGSRPSSNRMHVVMRKTLSSWNVEAMHELAAALGAYWEGSEGTGSICRLRDWPPVVSLAMMATALNDVGKDGVGTLSPPGTFDRVELADAA